MPGFRCGLLLVVVLLGCGAGPNSSAPFPFPPGEMRLSEKKAKFESCYISYRGKSVSLTGDKLGEAVELVDYLLTDVPWPRVLNKTGNYPAPIFRIELERKNGKAISICGGNGSEVLSLEHRGRTTGQLDDLTRARLKAFLDGLPWEKENRGND